MRRVAALLGVIVGGDHDDRLCGRVGRGGGIDQGRAGENPDDDEDEEREDGDDRP